MSAESTSTQAAAAAPAHAASAAAPAGGQLNVSRELLDLVRTRISILLKLDGIAARRAAMLNDDTQPRDAVSELSRQSGELRMLPGAESARNTIVRLKKKLDPTFDANEEPEPAEEQFHDIKVEEDAAPNDDDDSAGPDGQAPPDADTDPAQQLDEFDQEFEDEPSPDDAADSDDAPADDEQAALDRGVIAALELGIAQAELFVQRDEMTADILTAAAAHAAGEPLHRIFVAHGHDARDLFGWAIYAIAVQTLKDRTERKMRTVLSEAAKLKQRKGKPAAARSAKLSAEAEMLKPIVDAAARELTAIDKRMVKAFWDAYADAAGLLASGDLSDDDQPHVRAMLRHGMISAQRWLLPDDSGRTILQRCAEPTRELDESDTALHVLYADEYIDLVSRGLITGAIDQDLELNARGSDAWKRDKLWRRQIYSQTRQHTLGRTLQSLEARHAECIDLAAKLEAKLSELSRDDPKYKQKRLTWSERVQESKVEAARLIRHVESLRDKLLPEEQRAGSEALGKLDSLGGAYTPVELARREATEVHRVSRLCAKLKDPFLPFVLRDKYQPQGPALNDRDTVIGELVEAERLDPAIFREVLFHAKKKDARVTTRFAPYVLLTPSMGIMGFSWNPRCGSEVGRLVLPGINARPGDLRNMLYNVLSDFRWDTSKASAGTDVMKSDTLVAAFMTVRWDYRKRSKEIREKAGLFNEENDRENWRRHYALYMSSADDAGKKLFFRCHEVYEAVCKYMDLPEGVERLSK